MLKKAQAIAPRIVELRRELHRMPELGYQERRTAEIIQNELESLGIAFRGGVARTGVVAEMGRGEGPLVALRADMDALPILEQTGLPFASENPGLMHACGHDAHMAMLLGAARLLRDFDLPGRVRLVFQPSEENNLGDEQGYSGAKRMLEEGVFEDVEAALGLHQAPMLPTGSISLGTGAVLAAADRIRIEVLGKAAHAGVNPEQGVDALLIAGELVCLLQPLISRGVGPGEQAVISIGTIEGGSTYNVVADRVLLTGTTRALDDAVYQRNIRRIAGVCEHLGAMRGAEIRFAVEHAVPVTRNDQAITAVARESASRIFPKGGVLAVPPLMGGEDFAFVAARIPSCFGFLGTRPSGRPPGSLHHPGMILDEAALPLGAAFLARGALDLLEHLARR